MASFTDTEKRAWTLRLTHGDVMRLKKALSTDLYKAMDNRMAGMVEIMSDPEKLVTTVFFLIEDVAREREVSPEDFANALDGSTLEAMAEAFWEMVADFFPKSKKTLMAAQTKAKEMEAKAQEKAAKAMEALDLDKELEKLSTASSTNAPVPPTSTPTPEASAS